MNEQFKNNIERDDDTIAQKLSQVAEQTQANGHFAAELEQKVRSAYRPQTGWLATFRQVSPTLRWVALMVLLAVVLSWSIKSLVPAPQPAVQNTPSSPNLSTPVPSDLQNTTPAPEGEGIDFRGAKLFMNATLPDSPGQANVYHVAEPQPVTVEYARSLAGQLGITGDVYITRGQNPGTSAYMVTDGKQQLEIYGESNYYYTSDMVTIARNYNGFENDNAEAIIREFLQSHGFDANVKATDSGPFGGYTLQQLTPDGLPIEYENYAQPSVRITLKENGEVLSMTVIMAQYDPAGLGSFGIISAEEAYQKILDENVSAGKIETGHSGLDETYVPPQVWYHEYPDNEAVTIYGNIASSKAADAGKPAIVFIDTVQAIGNIDGMDALEYYTFIEATGQFVVENGVRKFNVETWNRNVQNVSLFGGVRREGDQVIVTDQNGGINTEYILADPPVDLPSEVNFPESQVSVNGAAVDGKLYWTMIDYYADTSNMGGGGGGGGGMGFYQLNLSGTPIPFPTPTAIVPGAAYTTAEIASFLKHTVKEGDTVASIAAAYNVSVNDLTRVNNITDANVIGVGWVLTIPGVPGPTQLDGEEGTMQVQIFQKPDGRLREAYTFISKKDHVYYQVQGESLKQLQDVANRPIKIWGAISYDEMGTPLLTFERFETLYPELQFEVLTGTQQNKEIDGNSVILFTAQGTTYVQMDSSGGYLDYNAYDGAKEVNLEVLRIPGETYGGYPTVRVLNSGPAADPSTGATVELPRVTDKIEIYPDPFGNADTYVPPDLIIDSVELVYLTNHPAYRDSENPDAPVGQGYIQPVWHFQGHYSNGDVLDILIQALKEEYLSPELSEYMPPG